MRPLTFPPYVCLLAAAQAIAANSPTQNIEITFRLYDAVGLAEPELRQTIEETTRIFRQANFDVTWVRCELNFQVLPPASPCRDAPNSFWIGLLHQSPQLLPVSSLGFALIRPGPSRHAGVVYSRAADMARSDRQRLQTYQILAYAIAHEVAHLILGSTSHSVSGLLRRTYGTAELVAISQRRLLFSPREAAALRRCQLTQRTIEKLDLAAWPPQ